MLADVTLLYTNSVQYNGESHSITATAAKIVQICKEQFDEHTEQFDALEKNLERQAQPSATTMRTTESISDDIDWQQTMMTDPNSYFAFNPPGEGRRKMIGEMKDFLIDILENEENTDVKSPNTFGMSLETFIAEDFSVPEHHLQAMETEQNEDNDDEQLDATGKITTEDILGMTDEFSKNKKGYIPLSLYSIGNISESDMSDDDDDESSARSPSHSQMDASKEPHKHQKKRLKTSHPTSTDPAALQLSEDELE